MPFTRKIGNKNEVDYKARLQHKLYLARTNPTPVYDISECNLENVPSDTYDLCKLFKKKSLMMQCNRLKSLLDGGTLISLCYITVLDLHSNELISLPSDIIHLRSLKELYIQENKILKLPNEIMYLNMLSILNIAKNKLKHLPEGIGKLTNLVYLNISHNKTLRKLPKSLGKAQQIKQLEIEGLQLSYPPKDVQAGGAVVIIAFLANECDIDCSPIDCLPKTEIIDTMNSLKLKSVYDKHRNIQEQRQNTLLEVENNIKEQQNQELKLHNKLKLNKQKLLTDLAQQQSQLQKEIEKVQRSRDVNRSRLLSYICDAEKEADNVIKEFLHGNENKRKAQMILLEIEKQQEMQLLSTSHSEQSMHRTRDTLIAMRDLLEEELINEKKFEEYAAFRNCNAQSLLNLEVKHNNKLLKIIHEQQKNRQEIITNLKEDEQLQKAVLTALLERSDARSWSIIQQVNLVQSQLEALTNTELKRKKFEINQQINNIADKRTTLSAILVNLLEQQEKRRHEILETVKYIEQQQNTFDSIKGNSSFWLLQYQNLIDTRPHGLLKTLDSSLVRHIAVSGALHCLPFLSDLPSLLHNLHDSQLETMGIQYENDRTAIMSAVQNYLLEKKLDSYEYKCPSAPPEEPSCSSSKIEERQMFQPSAPSECIVCMDFECEIIFLPCGHVCCCTKCTDKISMCPMCRNIIERKVIVSRQ